MTIQALRDAHAGQQVVVDVDVELVIKREDVGEDHHVLTFHDGRRTLPLPGSVEITIRGDQLCLTEGER